MHYHLAKYNRGKPKAVCSQATQQSTEQSSTTVQCVYSTRYSIVHSTQDRTSTGTRHSVVHSTQYSTASFNITATMVFCLNGTFSIFIVSLFRRKKMKNGRKIVQVYFWGLSLIQVFHCNDLNVYQSSPFFKHMTQVQLNIMVIIILSDIKKQKGIFNLQQQVMLNHTGELIEK